ncbi:uncharacterized protein VICG_00716 [Vittaforma corneae ATCC 50505]|uniref:Uncharacterized protein n=1 Tax=Vittaforma corneae (strain ATCC 50505) TaxID=993615 RepID=L2GNA4_VITCO|nr:uncharacterized protein VICG_00716 [Vittaforma corneae ATCC 50505]ELA42316.1 hypothetical protein VICG_00716 [Vittaforma corneae ATCC 50505]
MSRRNAEENQLSEESHIGGGNDIASVSEDNPTHGIIDDLYILKHSLIKNKKLTPQSISHLSQIENIISEIPELSKNLYEWNFLENEILYFLRAMHFKMSLRVITKIVSITNKAPGLYFTKKFLFFITEKLYFAMGGSKIYKKNSIINMRQNSIVTFSDKTMKNQNLGSGDIMVFDEDSSNGKLEDDSSFQEMLGFGAPNANFTVNEITRLIMIFIRKLIEINRNVVTLLNELLFFELANVCICVETAQLFNSIFVNISYSEVQQIERSRAPWQQDGLYEVRRKYFEPEVFFRAKDIFYSIKPVENFKSGIYKQIYDQCTNLKDFADLSFKDTADIMLFKRIVYMSDELDLLILEGKDPKVVKFYRRCLEAGAVPEKSHLNSIIKAVDNSKTTRDACIVLYYFQDYLLSSKPFTENRIRKIIQNLEYLCGSECTQSKSTANNSPSNIEKKEVIPVKKTKIEEHSHSFDSNLCTNDIFGDSCNNGLFCTPQNIDVDTKGRSKGILEDFSEFENDFSENKSSLGNGLTISNDLCERYRILKLLQHVYPIVNHQFFYKPSYLILFRSMFDHVPSMQSFIIEFFTDFIRVLKLNKMNIARIFLPVFRSEKKPKTREIKLEEQSSEYLAGANNNVSNMPLFRVKGGVIESSEFEHVGSLIDAHNSEDDTLLP